MKKILILLLFLLTGLLAYAQQPMSKVVLKSGVTITGTIKELNPTSHVILVVGGFETRIEMNDVSSIEEVLSGVVSTSADNKYSPIEEIESYPEFYTLKIGPYDVEMKLVRGVTFEMGYDGQGSRSFRSEPVHPVTLSSFYVNLRPLSDDVVTFLKKGKEKHNDKQKNYHPSNWNDANGVIEAIIEKTGLPVNIISEAQWEYVAVNTSDILFINGYEVNYCQDYYSDYRSTNEPQVDPIGPMVGKSRVVREFDGSVTNNYYKRLKTGDPISLLGWAIRMSIPASAIK